MPNPSQPSESSTAASASTATSPISAELTKKLLGTSDVQHHAAQRFGSMITTLEQPGEGQRVLAALESGVTCLRAYVLLSTTANDALKKHGLGSLAAEQMQSLGSASRDLKVMYDKVQKAEPKGPKAVQDQIGTISTVLGTLADATSAGDWAALTASLNNSASTLFPTTEADN